MAMTLLRFRVTNFRSVADSGWIDVNSVTALIGANESGKTNLLLPLWKLNPAKEGAINPTSDFPRKDFTELRHRKPQPVFVEAVLDAQEALAAELGAAAGVAPESVREVAVSRRFDGEYLIDFPNAKPLGRMPAPKVNGPIDAALHDIEAGGEPPEAEKDLRGAVVVAMERAKSILPSSGDVSADAISRAAEALSAVAVPEPLKTSKPAARFMRLQDELSALHARVTSHPRDVEAARKLVLGHLPKFVYYSNYGNLDSEIYLPHVIQNMARADLGAKEQAKARTLKVLFEFVRLQPQEILELGRDFKDPSNPNRSPTPQEVAGIAEKKKQRSILLQSASTHLTRSFREWWRQGDYRFRFEADGDHFRIWVSDDKRPEEIELEGRSTGLQWFLSFYLVFLVESADAHEDAILLLDEPGLSLHPLAQRDLSDFFDGLARTNQLLYTTHSPFLVDADRLDRVRKVYVADDGTTKATPDLRAQDGNIGARGAGYAVHAALGLSVAESLLLGCTPVVVEGTSDQHYLSAIKTILVAAGMLVPGRELVFPPCGGAKGVKAVASILGGKEDELPTALLDSDRVGREMAEALKKTLYVGGAAERVLEVGAFVGVPGAEIEDLLPPELIAREVDRWQRSPEVSFTDSLRPGKSVVSQIEEWAAKHKVELGLGWKVELAIRVKKVLLKQGPPVVPKTTLENWKRLFDALQRVERSP
jgi:putative AbiEii toxin of type IV toxin-antitoxin system